MYTNPFRKITETRKCDNCVKLTNQREKVLIGKHIDFSVEKSVLWIRITLIAVKVGTKLVSFIFKPLFWTYAKTALKNVQMMLRWLSSSIGLIAKDAIYHGL